MGKITKSTIAAGLASIVLLLSGCPLLPPPNNAPTLEPEKTSIIINEGQDILLAGKVSDDNSGLDQILLEVSSDRFAFSSIEKTLPDNFSIKGSPINKNYYGSAYMDISATDHNGARITFRVPVTVKDTPDLVVTDWPTSIEVDKGQAFQLTFKLTDDYSDWYNGITKSFVCDKYNLAFEAINATDGRLTFTPKDPGYVGTTDFGMTISDDEGNTTNKTLEIIVNDVVNPNNPPEISGPASLIINEGLQAVVDFNITDDNTEFTELLIEAMSEQYNVSLERIAPNTVKVTGTPKDRNYYGSAGMTVEATDLEGGLATYALPITVKDTPDLVVTDWPTSIEADKGQSFQIAFKLTDDYSDWYNGITKSFVCDKYNLAFEAINATDGRLTFTPKDPSYIGTASFSMTISDDEGNTTTRSLEIIVKDVANSKPAIEIPDFTIKEGENKDVTVKIADEDPLSQLEVAVSSDRYNVSYQKVNDTDLLITFTKLNEDYNGPAGVTVQATDTQNLGEKVTKTFQVTPMTDLSYSIKDMIFTYYPGTSRIKTYSISSPTSEMNIEAFLVPVTSCDFLNKEVNVDRSSAQKILDTSIMGSLFEFKVEPSEVLENIIELHFSKNGYTQRYILANISKDNATRELVFPQSTREMNVWLAALHQLCYEPIVSGGLFKIPLSLAKWGFDIEDKEMPNAVVVIPEGETVPQIWVDKTINVFKDTFGTNIPISYAQEDLPPYENKIYSKYFGGAGSGQVGFAGLIAYNHQNVFYVGDVKFDYNYIYRYVLNQKYLQLEQVLLNPAI